MHHDVFIEALMDWIESERLCPSQAEGSMLEYLSRLGEWRRALLGNMRGAVMSIGREDWNVSVRIGHGAGDFNGRLKLKIWGDIGRVDWMNILEEVGCDYKKFI
jgi:hypothetical protein